MPESFAPAVKVNGRTITPPGWVWVLSYALAGCEWAIKQADTDEFRAMIRQSIVDRSCLHWEAEIQNCERKISELRAELHVQ